MSFDGRVMTGQHCDWVMTGGTVPGVTHSLDLIHPTLGLLFTQQGIIRSSIDMG